MSLDKKENFILITGKTADNARYMQKGKRYLANGTPVAAMVSTEPEPDPVKDKLDLAGDLGKEGLLILPASTIKKMVERLDGDYVDKRTGIDFILGYAKAKTE